MGAVCLLNSYSKFTRPFIYIPLDIFRNIPHNEIGELEAWLYFLSSDNPVHIQRLLDNYPAFAELYKEIINFRFHPKELISMFSEALAIMDRNTEKLMIDDMKDQIKEMEAQLQEKHEAMMELDNTIAEKDNALSQKDAEIARLRILLQQLENSK